MASGRNQSRTTPSALAAIASLLPLVSGCQRAEDTVSEEVRPVRDLIIEHSQAGVFAVVPITLLLMVTLC
jgi:hypothetical protein